MPFKGIVLHAIKEHDVRLDPSFGATDTQFGIVNPSNTQVPSISRSVCELWDELGLDQVDLLKVDTGGFESEFLESLSTRLHHVRTALVDFRSRADLDRTNDILDRFTPRGESWFDAVHGVAKFVRADLTS
jgi:hypothetical protein